MDEELRKMYLEKLKSDIEGLDDLEAGSKERLSAVLEIEKLTKQLSDDFKNQQAAWDHEQAREMNERLRLEQVEADKKKAKLDAVSKVAGPIAGGIMSLLGTRYVIKFIKAMEDGGMIPNREIMKWLPKFKF